MVPSTTAIRLAGRNGVGEGGAVSQLAIWTVPDEPASDAVENSVKSAEDDLVG